MRRYTAINTFGMDETEATTILESELARYRKMSYVDLWDLAEEPRIAEIIGASGVTYQVEAQAWWDDASRTNIRVLLSIDDGSWRSFLPLSRDFLVAPDGSFVGE
jgi:hypothetical protein